MLKNIFTAFIIIMPVLLNAQADVEDKNVDGIYATAGLDKQPEFPGGQAAFYNYVRDHLRIPEVGVDLNVRMLVTFIVEKDGTMTDISVSKDPGFGLRKEAIRMMSAVEEKWLPGLKDGEPVRVRYALPIKVVAKAPAEPQNIEE